MTRARLRLVLVVAALVVVWISDRWRGGDEVLAPPPAPEVSYETAPGAGEATILEAYRTRQSDVWVEAEGRVERVLRDDLDGSRHQRLIVRLSGGHTVLIAHNIDLAPRAPVREGDAIAFRGEYEWNDRGGVVHWTHHDPQGRRAGGWLRHEGERYQ